MTEKKQIVFTILALLVIGFPLAFDLGQAPIQTWDEARQAVNALEMLRSGGQWLVTTFNHHPDLGNTKPPLLIWLQALSMGCFGATELAVRLPSLLASLGTVALLYGAGRWLGRPGWGLLAGAILVTMPGYLGPHLARTGDYEALLCFWVLGQVLATFAYAETGRTRYLVLAAGAVAAALLTKGVAGVLGLPALALYLLVSKKLVGTLRRPAFWLAAGASLAVPALYYVLRERAGPGYWAAVWGFEVGGRYGHNLATAQQPPLYYVRNLVGYQCRLWWPWLLPAGWLLATSPPTSARRLGGLLGLFLLDWLLIISSAKTKLEWYTAPMLPALALLLALGLGVGYRRAQARWLAGRPGLWRAGLALAAALALLVVPYALAIRRLVRERHDVTTWGGVNSYSTYLRYYRPVPVPAEPLVVYYPVDYRHGAWASQFYLEVLAERGVALRRCNPDSLPPLAAGRRVLVCLPQVRATLLRRYAVRLVDQREVCTLYEVQGPAKAAELR
ncbi:MAG: ArnT family glycosyltransferase [Janthinobacterium lividum]